MASIFDMGETPITKEYLKKLGFKPVWGEYASTYLGSEYFITIKAVINGKCVWCNVTYREWNPNSPKGEPDRHALLVMYREGKYFGYKETEIIKVYQGIESEFELISHIKKLESELGVELLANK